jgi:hypothetical protein
MPQLANAAVLAMLNANAAEASRALDFIASIC